MLNKNARLQLQFLGAVGTVTGSKTLVRIGKASFLVDCGLFQGLKSLRLRNREDFPVDPRSIDSVILTHAHLDHCGYLPLLVKQGFRGRIYCTAPTKSLVKLVLEDAAQIQEEDAEFANKEGFSKHHPAKPLFTLNDVKRVERLMETVREGKSFRPIGSSGGSRGIAEARFLRNGHILGSCFVEIKTDRGTVVFSGDLGRNASLLFPDPKPLPPCDALVLESTYGDREHPIDKNADQLSSVILETIHRGGSIFIPSFAIGRTQEVLLLIARLKAASRLPAELPIYLDSPMAGKATEIFEAQSAWHQVGEPDLSALCSVAKWTRTPPESIRMMREAGSKVVIAGSGMAAGGRILHHLSHALPQPQNTILFIGYQAMGTRGRQLIEGAQEVKIHGRFVPVRAQVKWLPSFSAHADQKELIQWALGRNGNSSGDSSRKGPPVNGTIFLQHGDPQSVDTLRCRLESELISAQGAKKISGQPLPHLVIPEEGKWYTVGINRSG